MGIRGRSLGNWDKPEEERLLRTIWVHEDDIAQVEFLPQACMDFCRHELWQIARHSEEYRDPDGIGWTKMYQIPPAPAAVADLNIRVSDLAAAIPWSMRRVNRVLTGGWSGEGEPMPRTAAYVAGTAAIVFGWREDKIVDSLWYLNGAIPWWRQGTMHEALFRIGILAPLLLVDWRGAVIELNDRKTLRTYLSGRGAVPEEPPEPVANDQPHPSTEPANALYRFDAPVFPALLSRKYADGPVEAVLATDDGRGWRLRIDDAVLGGGALEPPQRFAANDGAQIIDWADAANGLVLATSLLDARERLNLWNAQSGERIAEDIRADTAVLTPDGDHLILFEDDGLAVMDLRRPGNPPRQSGLFPMATEEAQDAPDRGDAVLDNPGSVVAVATPAEDGRFWLAIGDYGFAVLAELRIGGEDESPLFVTGSARTFSEGLVYDPVDIVDLVPGERLVVRHGHGCGVTWFDLQTGDASECPLPDGAGQGGYGSFKSVVGAGPGDGLWLNTKVGPCFWTGSGALRPVPQQAGAVLATDGENYLGISPDGRTLIRGSFSDA